MAPDGSHAPLVTNLLHVELSCTDVEASRQFFVEVMGMQEQARAGGSVRLRCWGDWQSYSLVLSPGSAPGAIHTAWGVPAGQDLAGLEERLAARGVTTWRERDEPGQTEGLRFRDPDGQVHELIAEPEHTAADGSRSRLHNQPLPLTGVGIEPRRLDHLHMRSAEINDTLSLLCDVLGFKRREVIRNEGGDVVGAFVSVTSKVHDIALTSAPGVTPGLHHIAVWLDSREGVIRAADLLANRGMTPDVGPANHACTQAFYSHVLEPSGNRIELYAAEYSIFDPNWQPIGWSEALKADLEVALTGYTYRRPRARSDELVA